MQEQPATGPAMLEESRGSSVLAQIAQFRPISVGTFLDQQIAPLFHSALLRNTVKLSVFFYRCRLLKQMLPAVDGGKFVLKSFTKVCLISSV